jgi:3,4-dihydroxy 2-butanone 4-phosphate synthase/GTP cyclohydrolase II
LLRQSNPIFSIPFSMKERPFVTVSYAQSVDGSIAAASGGRLSLSDRESLRFVHRLRSLHDAILVGIGTVLSDNPRLTVRRTRGKNPRPVVVDTHLRMPLSAYLLSGHPLPLLIAAGEHCDAARCRALERRGAEVVRLPVNAEGRVDLPALLKALFERGVKRLMVEGGAGVITSFIGGRFVDRMAITIAPLLVGGMPALHRNAGPAALFPSLKNISYRYLGRDIVLQGNPEYA